MYLVEKGKNSFTSIPDSIYRAIVTISTVGYGDISPTTPLGKFVASIIMLMGYGIIAVPTGIITTEMALAARKKNHSEQACRIAEKKDIKKMPNTGNIVVPDYDNVIFIDGTMIAHFFNYIADII